MQYLGGKSRLAKAIAEVVNKARPEGATVWEPFMGGGAVTAALSKSGPVDASDLHEGLITMWRAALDGWVPDPRIVNAEMYAEYKATQDMSDPYTAFLGFGCSYGGKWFGGFAGWRVREDAGTTGTDASPINFYPLVSARTAMLQSRVLFRSRCRVFHFDFVNQDRPDWPAGWPIYCDPPYANTTGYNGVPDFDHDAFWARVATYARRGVPVFVSEFSEPPELDGVKSALVWSKARKNQMNGASVVDRLDLFTGE